MTVRRTRRPRGGRGGYEPRARIAARAERVWALSARGRTQREIAADVGISQPAVSKILRRAEDRMLATLHRERFRWLVRVQARTEHVYRQAQDGWERSGAERQRRLQRRTTAAGVERDVVEVWNETQAGDPRFLREQLRAVAEHRNTLKLHALDWVHIADTLEHGPAHTQRAEDVRIARRSPVRRPRKPTSRGAAEASTPPTPIAEGPS